MMECSISLSYICRKVVLTLVLAACFCSFVIAEQEAEQDATVEQTQTEIPERLKELQESNSITERQKKLLESMGVEYDGNESFDDIMSRAQQNRRAEKEAQGETARPFNPLDVKPTPEMIKMQEEAAVKAREEYNIRKRKMLEKNKDRLSPEALRVLNQEKAAEVEAAALVAENAPNEQPAEDTTPVKPVDQIPLPADSNDNSTSTKNVSDENTELELTITLPEKVEITALIELVGKQLGLNYIYDPAEIKGEVMLKVHNGKIKVKETYALLESVLKFRGFVMTRRGNLVTIVPAAKAADIDPVLLEQGDEVKPGDVIVTSVYKLENIGTEAAQNLLSSMNLSSNIISLPETKSIIVTGYAYRMERVEKMLSLVDVAGEKRDFSYRRLEYTLASSVVDKIQALAENLGTVNVTVSSTASSHSKPSTPQPVKRDSRGRVIPQPKAATSATKTTTGVVNSGTSQGGVYLDVDDRTNRILMIGTEDDIVEVNKLIDTFDVPKQDLRKIVKYTIEFADAADVLGALEDLKIITTNSNSSSSSRTMTRPTTSRTSATQQGTQQSQVGTDESGNLLLDEPQVVMIEQSNSLLVNATDEQHEKIVSIIGFIDQEPEQDMAPVKVYPLENQSVEDIEETLTNVVEKVAKEKAEAEQGSSGGSSSSGKVQKASVGKNIPDVVITGDPGTNSIVVFASRKDQEWIATLIKDLDKKRPQVLIDVTLVEVTKDDIFTYDLNAVTNITGDISDSVKYPPAIDTQTNESLLEFSWGGGTLGGFYSDENIQAVLDLMQTKNYGRVMAKPKLLVNDNQEGEISSENVEYIASVSTNVLGTEGSSTSTDVAWESYNAGVTLTITPHISEGDLLRLEIVLDRTDFGTNANEYTTSEGAKITGPKDTISNKIDTVITVPNESTIILGGLTKINQNKGTKKVPFLGDLPIIGILFRGVNNSDSQSRLYVFIKANILRPDDNMPGLPDLEHESDLHRQAFEESEAEFQEHEQWPGVDSEIVEPERVLDMK